MKLEDLKQDDRLFRVINSDCNFPCTLNLWLMELTKDNLVEYRLLYGWVIPSNYKNHGCWYSADGGSKDNFGEGSESYKFRIPKLNLYDDQDTIFKLIKELYKGSSLNEACDKINISRPPNSYGKLKLGNSKDNIDQNFAIRPTIFLETRDSIIKKKNHLRGLSSPIKYASAFSASLVNVNKFDLFKNNNGEELLERDNLIKKVLLNLKKETGFSFTEYDSKRLGNIEWLSIPTIDEYENSSVIIKPLINNKNKTYKLKVQIISEDNKGDEFLIRCRLRNSNEIVTDECKICNSDEEKIEITFISNEIFTNNLITIWKKTSEDNWEIWYENINSVFREFDMEMSYPEYQANIESEVLQDYKNSSIRKRIDDFEKIEYSHSEQSKISDNTNDFWRIEGEKTIKLTNNLFPEKFGGGFFKKGWKSEETEPGILNFIEWFIGLTEDSSVKKLLLIDPYFDTVGIELFSRVKSRDIKYEVLTCTQIKSIDDKEGFSENDEEPQRALRLKRECEKMKGVLSKLDFSLCDLRSTRGGNKSLFHDRYLLMFNNNEEIKKGFHLSNSIQGATKKAPLLVTTIDNDIIKSVNDYVNDLINVREPTVNEAEIIKLFVSKNNRSNNSREYVSGISAIPNANLFFSKLLQANELLNLEEEKLKNQLMHNNFIIEDGFVIPDDIDQYINSFVYILKNIEQEKFNKLINSFGEWLARIYNPDKCLNILIEDVDEKFIKKLMNFIKNRLTDKSYFKQSELEKLKNNFDILKLLQLMKKNFNETLNQAESLMDYSLDYVGVSDYPLLYTTKIIIQLEPENLFNLIINFIDNLEEPYDRETNITAYPLYILTKEIIDYFILSNDIKFIESSLKSDISLYRSLSVNYIIKNYKDKSDLSEAFNLLNNLSDFEQLKSLLLWVYKIEYKSKINKQGEERLNLKDFSLEILKEIQNNWIKNISKNNFRKLFYRFSEVACEITDDLLIPLTDSNKLELEKCANVWLDIFYEKLENGINSEQDIDLLVQNNVSLVSACGGLIIEVNNKLRTEWIDKFKRIYNQCTRVLYEPFIRSKDYFKFTDTLDVLLWIQIFIKDVLLCENQNPIREEEMKKIKEFDKKLSEVLKGYCNSQKKLFNDNLFSYYQHISKLVKENDI